MANSDKNILITPHVGGVTQPNIVFTGQGNDPITLRVLDGVTGTGITSGGALSFEGSAGQLFSIVNRLGTGSIFSVNDISGIPSIDVDANGTIEFAPFTGYVGIGTTAPTEKLDIIGNIKVSGNYIGNVVRTINGLTAAVNIAAGSNITITPSGQTLTIASTASGGGGTSYRFFEGTTATGFSAGDRWFDTNLGKLFTAVTDGVNVIWVEFGGIPGPTGAAGQSAIPGGITGSVQFSTGTAFNGSTGFIWDNTNIRLGIGITSPTMALDVVGNAEFTGEVFATSNLIRVATIARHWFI